MEYTVDIKPILADDDEPDKSFPTVPPAGIGKLKYSRYEDVWPEDVHAAFMEAVALYPPMGKRRLKYYRISTRENENAPDSNRPKSFGRCQLIQSYILEKTGKNRSRKQVSSHLQRLKKIYKDNPAMQPLFSERPLSLSDSEHRHSAPQAISSRDSSKNIPLNPTHIKSDLDSFVNPVSLSSSTNPFASEALFPTSGGPCHALTSNSSTSLQGQPSSHQDFLSPVPQRCPVVTLCPSSDSDSLPELQDPSLVKDAINEATRSGTAFNASGIPTSLRHFTSKLPVQARLVDSGSTAHFSRTAHSLGFQTTPQWISHDGLPDGICYNSPFPSAQEAFHTSFRPFQLTPSDRQRLYPSLSSERLWPKDPDLPFDPREASFTELRLRYPSTLYHSYPELVVNTPGFNGPPSETEIPRYPRRISYSYALTSPPTGESSRFSREISYSYAVPGPATVSNNVSNESAIDFPRRSPESYDDFASPFVISPTPVYPVSYIHSDVHPDNFTPIPSFLQAS